MYRITKVSIQLIYHDTIQSPNMVSEIFLGVYNITLKAKH